jgi:hypothetical protein
MKDSRIGESLWYTWEGDTSSFERGSMAIYYTEEHVDLENETVRRALASSLQRDGIALSLAQGFQMINHSNITTGYIGIHFDDPEEINPEISDGSGFSSDEVLLNLVRPVTFVEVSDF